MRKLTPVFEWDDAVAAERHRETIRSVKVITQDKPSEPVQVHVTSGKLQASSGSC